MYRNFIFVLSFVLWGIIGCTNMVGDFPTDTREISLYTPIQSTSSTLAFRVGDQIGLYPVRYKDGVSGTLGDITNVMNAQYTYTTSGWEAAPGDEIFLDATPIDLYAFSPYDPAMSRAPEKMNLSAYPFDVSGNQAERNCDFLWTKISMITQSNPNVGIIFDHLMIQLRINLKYTEIDNTEPNISVHNTKTNCTINLRSGGVTVGNESKTIIPLQQPKPTAGYNRTYEALLPSQTIMAGTPLFLIEYLGETWTYTISQDVNLKILNSYVFNLTIDGQASTPMRRIQSVLPVVTQEERQ